MGHHQLDTGSENHDEDDTIIAGDILSSGRIAYESGDGVWGRKIVREAIIIGCSFAAGSELDIG